MQESRRHVLFQKLFVVGGKHQSLLLFFTIQTLFLIVTVYASFGLLRYLSRNVEELGFLEYTLKPVVVFWLIAIIAVHEFGHLFWIRKYGIPVLGPIPILFDGAYVSLEVLVEGIGKRYCRDSGSAILIIGKQFHPELGIEVPYMNIDILWNFQIENNFPPWNTGLNFGEIQMTIEQFEEKRDLLDL